MEGAGVDLLLVTDLVNVRYLAGFTGSNGLVLVGPSTRVFISDFRYTEQAEQEVPGEFERVTAAQDLLTDAVDHLPEGKLALGFESEHTTVAALERLQELFPERVELIGTKKLIENLRVVKDEHEIELIAAATKIADDAFEALIASGVAGRTELQLDRRRRATRGAAPRPASRRQDRSGPAGRDRLGRADERLLLRLHPHGRRRRARSAGA
jgi:Xaa-Pro aminopeptidase